MLLASYLCYAVFCSALCPEVPLLRGISLEWLSPNGNLKISPTREVQFDWLNTQTQNKRLNIRN